MKSIIAALLLTSAFSAFARPVSLPHHADHEKAIKLIATDANFTCTKKGSAGNEYVNYYLDAYITKNSQATVDNKLEQPLFTFTTINGKQKIVLTISTNDLYNQIADFKYELFQLETVNLGDLVEPIFRDVYVLQESNFCQAE